MELESKTPPPAVPPVGGVQQQPAALIATERSGQASVPQEVRVFRHTRRCNGREPVCSCMLRLEGAYFRKNLAEKAAKKRRAATVSGTVKRVGRHRNYVRVSNLQQFSMELKLAIVSFLSPASLATLGMTNRALRREVELLAKHQTDDLMSAESRRAVLLKDTKHKQESWPRYMHMQLSCVHKLFVYYTGYKTGPMREQFPHWTFGVVFVDPNAPHRIILPNTWDFHGYKPWLQKRGNGKDGEWKLRANYKTERAPKEFHAKVKSWASTIRPGSHLAIAYQNAGSLEPAWWEAQAWYVWRGDGKQSPALVLDPETNTQMQVHPDDLLDHFTHHPLHVIDVCSTPGALCRRCSSHGRSFKYCHVDKGHPML